MTTQIELANDSYDRIIADLRKRAETATNAGSLIGEYVANTFTEIAARLQALSVEAEAVAVVDDCDDYGTQHVKFLDHTLPVGTKLYAHPSPKVEAKPAVSDDGGFPFAFIKQSRNNALPLGHFEIRSGDHRYLFNRSGEMVKNYKSLQFGHFGDQIMPLQADTANLSYNEEKTVSKLEAATAKDTRPMSGLTDREIWSLFLAMDKTPFCGVMSKKILAVAAAYREWLKGNGNA